MFKIVNKYAENMQIINKSKFICYLKQTSTIEEAEDFIKYVNTIHPDATHNCYAYIVGDSQEYRKCSDDGEPSGTAGLPMLNVLEKNNITDTTAVVTRYYGGIMLGAGGLVRAYGGAVKEGLDVSTFVKKIFKHKCQISISYENSKLEKLIRDKFEILNIIYNNDDFIIEFITDDLENTKLELTNLTKGNSDLVYLGKVSSYISY